MQAHNYPTPQASYSGPSYTGIWYRVVVHGSEQGRTFNVITVTRQPARANYDRLDGKGW